MAILSTIDATVAFVLSSDPDVDVALPQIEVPSLDGDGVDLVDAPARWCSVSEVRALGGEVKLGATVVEIRPLNGAEYCQVSALRPPPGERVDLSEMFAATLRAGVVDVQGYEGGKDGLITTLRWVLVDGLVDLILRASQGYDV